MHRDDQHDLVYLEVSMGDLPASLYAHFVHYWPPVSHRKSYMIDDVVKPLPIMFNYRKSEL